MYLEKDAAINKLQSAFRGHKHRVAHLNLSKPVHIAYEQTVSLARLSRRKFSFSLFAHLTYTALLCAVLMLQRGASVSDRLMVESAMREHITTLATPSKLTLMKATTLDKFWDWTQGAFLPTLSAETASGERPAMATYNDTVGTVRLEMVRVGNDSCPLWQSEELLSAYRVANLPSKCFGHNTPAAQTSAPYGPWYDPSRFTSVEQFGESRYVVDLSRNPGFQRKQVTELIDTQFASDHTRRISLTFLVYNHATALFCALRVFLNINAGGEGRVSIYTESLVAQEYLHNWYNVQIALEVLLLLWTALHIQQEVNQLLGVMRRFGRARPYFSSFSNLLDWGRIAALCALAAVWLMIVNDTSRQIDLLASDNVDLEWIVLLYRVYSVLVCLALLFSLTSLLQYFELSDKLASITRALTMASADLPYFLCLFGLFYLGFAFIGHLQFGDSLRSWGSITFSLITCYELMIGNYEFEELERSASGPDDATGYIAIVVYYYLFAFLMYFMMVNMLLAILMDGYMKVKEQGDTVAAKNHNYNLGPLSSDLRACVGDNCAWLTCTVCGLARRPAPKWAIERKWSEHKWCASFTAVQEMRRTQRRNPRTLKMVELVKALRELPENKEEDVLKQVLGRFHGRELRKADQDGKVLDPAEETRRLVGDVHALQKSMSAKQPMDTGPMQAALEPKPKTWDGKLSVPKYGGARRPLTELTELTHCALPAFTPHGTQRRVTSNTNTKVEPHEGEKEPLSGSAPF